MEFSESEVIRRSARRIGMTENRMQECIDAYADEWLRHAREVDRAATEQVPAAEAPAKPARPARKRTKPATEAGATPAEEKTAEGESEAQRMQREGQERDPENSGRTFSALPPDGTPPPPNEAERVTADS